MALSRFHTLLKTKIDAEIAKTGAQITSGGMTSYEGYREAVGYVRGLVAALKLADDTEVEMGE